MMHTEYTTRMNVGVGGVFILFYLLAFPRWFGYSGFGWWIFMSI